LSINKKNNNIKAKIARKLYSYYSLKYSCEISYHAQIGKGLFLPHLNGIIIHGGSIIGDNCCILQQVTIGENGNKIKGVSPKLGDKNEIGAGAKIIGPITIGDNVVVGANSVVCKDFESDVIIAGVPAKIIKSRLVK